MHVRDRVGQLVASFIGVRCAVQHGRVAEAEAVALDGDLRRTAIDVVGQGCLKRCGRVAEFCFQVAPVLKGHIVQDIRCQKVGPAGLRYIICHIGVAKRVAAEGRGRRGLHPIG